MNTVLRIDLDQQVNVVRHDLHLHKPGSARLDDFADDLLQPKLHRLAQNCPPILRTPHHMEGALEGYIAVRAQSDGHNEQYIAWRYLSVTNLAGLTPL